MRLRCTNCEAAFDHEPREREARCPKCLRRTTVREEGDVAPQSRDGAPAPWPAGTACPLCLAHPVTDATFHFELGDPHPRAPHEHVHERDASASALDPTGIARPALVRGRCCAVCRRRVVTLARLRWGALPFVALGMLAWPLSFASDLPFRLWGIGRLEMAMLSTLLCAFVIGIPLLLVDHANRSMRKNLETSWLFRRVRERLLPGRPHDAASREHWRLHADAPRAVTVVEATDLLRG